MVCNDICDRQVLEACRRSGIIVPDEIAVMEADNDETACDLSPLSSIMLGLESSGYDAYRAVRTRWN